MRLSNVANNGSAPQMPQSSPFANERGETKRVQSDRSLESLCPQTEFLRRRDTAPRRAFSAVGAIAVADPFPPPFFPPPLSSRNLSAPLMVFFALTLAKLDPKRNNKRRNGSS